ncbi:MAG: metal-dependent transcriptional regulator [Candidatus Hodarchaeales archaeon]|jgi:Mn-dependent DtxR family transcriptional regulator
MHEKKYELRDIEEEIMEILFDLTITKEIKQRIKMGEILDKLRQDLTKTQLTNIVRRKLEPRRFVDYTPYDGVLLTRAGFHVARRIARNHRLAEAMLYQIFDVPFSELHEQACYIEHGISDRLAELIFQKLKEKMTPFGDLIPMGEIEDQGCDDQILINVPTGIEVILTRITSHTTDTVNELESYEIQSVGVKMVVKDRDEEGVTVELNNNEYKIPIRISKNLCVKPN